MLENEMEEYKYWLKNTNMILKSLVEIGFEIEKRDNAPLHMLVISRLKNNEGINVNM
jgi:hypothetical protein